MTPARIVAPQIELPAFSGPFDLLLHLIEREALDITAISLAQVTEQYLEQVRELQDNRVEQLIDFLVIAARLLLIKSRALLPRPPTVPPDEEEEDPAEALVRQLRRYKRFKDAAAWLADRHDQGYRTFLRVAPPPFSRFESKLDMSGIKVRDITMTLQMVLARGDMLEDSVSVIRPPAVTIEGQLRLLRRRIKEQSVMQFSELISTHAGREEVAVTLLAVLELIKRHEIVARQPTLFGPIELSPLEPEVSS